MRRRFLLQVTMVSGLAAAAGGCAMVDHSNTMLFGTNTAVGVQVGVDTNNVPSVNIGYRRQEAVFLPLLANLKNDKGDFMPCPGTATVTSELTKNCKFIATNGEGKAEDSYSVLASFGADIKADTNGGAGASVGLAQYFATGTAAQLLALKGGAAVVAAGEAAKSSAEAPTSPLEVSALVGDSAAMKQAFAGYVDDNAKRKELVSQLEKVKPEEFPKELDSLSEKLGKPLWLRNTYCKDLSQAACTAKIGADEKFNLYIEKLYPPHS